MWRSRSWTKAEGVSPELLLHLFRRYRRVAGADGGIGGSGLGLAICKGLVEAHGGRIRAESGGEGLGTRFTFTIPVAEEPGTGAAAGFARRPSRPSREGRGRTRILVVDDDPQTLRYVRDALAAAGYSPLVTGDPQQVSRLIQTKKPRLVLLDLMLPEIDGIELMESIPEMADLPVLFISGYGTGRDDRPGPGGRGLRLHRQALLADGTGGESPRSSAPGGEPSEPFLLGELAIDYEERRVTVAGRPVQLTVKEYELLRVLSVNAGRVTTYDFLLRQVWSQLYSGDSRPVRTLVKKLRRKLGDDAANPSYIFSERSLGYRMARARQSDL